MSPHFLVYLNIHRYAYQQVYLPGGSRAGTYIVFAFLNLGSVVMNGFRFLFVLLSAAGCRTTEAKGNKQLTLAVFLSGVFTNQSEFVGGETFVTGLQLALDLLNNNSKLLPGYSVNASITDVKVSDSAAWFIYLMA